MSFADNTFHNGACAQSLQIQGQSVGVGRSIRFCFSTILQRKVKKMILQVIHVNPERRLVFALTSLNQSLIKPCPPKHKELDRDLQPPSTCVVFHVLDHQLTRMEAYLYSVAEAIQERSQE